METSLWCIDDICRQAPRDFDTRLQIIFGGCAVRNRLFAYHGYCLKRMLIEAPTGSLDAAAPPAARRPWGLRDAGGRDDARLGSERLPRAAAGYDALGTVSDNGSRTIFEALLGHLLRSYRAFVEDVPARDRIRANRGRRAYCLMPNHVNLILTPDDPAGLARAGQGAPVLRGLCQCAGAPSRASVSGAVRFDRDDGAARLQRQKPVEQPRPPSRISRI
jgi:hypothetical protein